MNAWKQPMALLAAAAGLALVCSAANAQRPADWDQVVAAAKKEGKVVMYSGNTGDTTNREIAEAFRKRYGITLEFLEARASEVRERIRSEQAAGRFIADLSHNGSTTTALQQREGAFAPMSPGPNQARLLPDFKPTGYSVPVYVQRYGILINTNLIKPGEEPKSWTDLTDPKWKGRIVADDMRALGGGSALFFVTYEKFGREFHDKLATQAIHFTRQIRESPRRVARGEFAMQIPMGFSHALGHEGLPIRVYTPREGNPYTAFEVAILKNAPNPNAARLLADFFLDDEVQLIYARGGRGPSTRVSLDSLPSQVRELFTAPLLGTTDADRQDAMLTLAREIYK